MWKPIQRYIKLNMKQIKNLPQNALHPFWSFVCLCSFCCPHNIYFIFIVFSLCCCLMLLAARNGKTSKSMKHGGGWMWKDISTIHRWKNNEMYQSYIIECNPFNHSDEDEARTPHIFKTFVSLSNISTQYIFCRISIHIPII